MKALARAALALCLAATLALCGCGYDPATGPTPTPQPAATPAVTAAPTPDGGLPTPEPLPTPTATPPSSFEFALIANDADVFGRDDMVIGDLALGASVDELLESRFDTPVVDETYTEAASGAEFRLIEYPSGDQYRFKKADGEYSLVQAANMNDRLEGPRGIRVGDSMEKVLAAFRCDGDRTVVQDEKTEMHILYSRNDERQDEIFSYVLISNSYELLGASQNLSNAVQIVYNIEAEGSCVFTIQDGTVALMEWKV